MLTRFDHLVRAAVAVAALSLLDPASARASGGGDFNFDLCDTTCELVLAGTLILPPLIFLTAELGYAAQWRWFPPGWAISELIYGALMTSMMVAVASYIDDAGGAALFVVTHGWLTTHALLSLVIGDRARGRPVRDAEQRHEKVQTERPQIGFAPLQGGAWVGVRGRL
jgi:hypothetical protein